MTKNFEHFSDSMVRMVKEFQLAMLLMFLILQEI